MISYVASTNYLDFVVRNIYWKYFRNSKFKSLGLIDGLHPSGEEVKKLTKNKEMLIYLLIRLQVQL